ncbi:MAG: protein kinase domain-containing protein, partial [Gemmataceae bacterium]
SPLRRQVALKFLALKRGYDNELAALRNEAAALASVRHPNVVQVFQWKQTAGGLPCLVLQFVPGGSLTDLVHAAGPLPWQAAGRYVADVAAGLQAVHARGLVHRDIKPDNVLHDPDADEALLTDFGIAARLVEARGSAGTLPFMAPEAIAGASGPPMDVYSLAGSLFWLLTADFPFPARDELQLLAAIRAGLPAPDPRLAGVPAPLEDLIRRGLGPDPARRPPLADFNAGLRGTLNGLLADALKMPASAPVGVRIVVSRRETDVYVPVAASAVKAAGVLRDLRRVPPPPDRVRVRTGDRVRIQVEADQPGFAVVFNVGPTGNLNLLSAIAPAPVGPGRPLHLIDVEMTPPAGNERIFALWTREPLPLRLEELRSLVEQAGTPTAGAYRATRDMARVKESLDGVPADDRRAAVLELEHAA